MRISTHAGKDVGVTAVLCSVARQYSLTQIVDRTWQLDGIAFLLQALQGVEQRFKYGQMRCSSHRTRIGWEVKNDDTEFAISAATVFH